MDFSFDETQIALRDLARQILEENATHERLKELEADGVGVFDRDLWQSLADAGITATVVPESHGGSGLGLLEILPVLEEVGRHVAPVPALPALVGALCLAEHGSDDQQTRWLPGVADGSMVLTVATDEGPGDDPLLPRTTISEGRVTGEKPLVPYAPVADVLLVTATTSESEPAIVLVDATTDGVAITAQLTTNRQSQGDVELEDAAGEVLAVGQDAVRDLTERIAAGACAVQAGVCEGALLRLADHASNREQFGKPIAEFQAVAQRAADAYIDTEMVRLTARQAIFRLSQGWDATKEVHAAKFWAGDGAMRVVHAAQHIHGGLGVDLDYPLHRYFLWAKQHEHTQGTPTRELIRLGGVLAEEPA